MKPLGCVSRFSVSVFLSVSVFVSLSPTLSLCVFVCLSVSSSLPLFLCLCLSVSVCLFQGRQMLSDCQHDWTLQNWYFLKIWVLGIYSQRSQNCFTSLNRREAGRKGRKREKRETERERDGERQTKTETKRDQITTTPLPR